MKSVMQHSFSEVPTINMPRSSFDRSHAHKTTFDADFLIPILVDDVGPGDTYSVGTSFVIRLSSPTILPLLDNMYFDTFAFFTPYRLLWTNWERFMGSQDDPDDTIDFTIPVIGGGATVSVADMADYMGIPPGTPTAAELAVSALPFRAMRLIWNEWFRDQNMQDTLVLPTDNGPDDSNESDATNACYKRGKRHDYFTSALPFPQRGSAVSLPLGTSADVHTIADELGNIGIYSTTAAAFKLMETAGTSLTVDTVTTDASTNKMFADLTNATAATINDLRLAFQTQALLEIDARSGTRYVETIKAHWKVTFPDYRAQRPIYLGGGSSRINVTPIAQTTYQGTQTLEDAKGALGGIGQVNGTHSWSKSFVEHGVLIILGNVRSDITYSQGIQRYWHKQTRYTFMYPILTGIGEQGILNQELWFTNTTAIDQAVFGYIGRYDEYRFMPSRLSALMRVDAASSLEAFHLSEDFAALPTLSDSFITSNTATPLDRAISVPSEPQFIADFWFDMKCARPMPVFGLPINLDRF